MTTHSRTALPIPKTETMDLWSRQMIEMQKMLLQPAPHVDHGQVAPKVEDDDDDLWDNMPV
mgnify:FL=1|jgi:hypothetical protein